jgi:hypothetical protein
MNARKHYPSDLTDLQWDNIDQLQDRLDQFNHERKIEVDGRILDLAS